MSETSILGRIKPSANRFADGMGVVGNSVALLKDRPVLFAYPLVAGLLCLGVLVAVTLAVWLVWPVPWWALLCLGVATYSLCAYVVVLFTAALIHEVRNYHRGVDLSLRAGLRAALSRPGTFLWWAAIVATVGAVLSILVKQQDETRGIVVGRLMELGWTAGTFFVTPAILFRDAGPFSMFTDSAALLSDNWQEIGGAVAGLKLAAYVTSLLGGSLAILLAGAGLPGPLAVVIGGPLILAGVLADLTLQGVVKATLYDHLERTADPAEASDHGVELDEVGRVVDDMTPGERLPAALQKAP